MKVITGRYRGKKIIAPEDISTRPTLQRAKETMFNMLPHNLSGGKCLDVFAGSGQLGMEALSRGLEYCIFNEKGIEASKTLVRNLSTVPISEYNITTLDYKDFIKNFKYEKQNLILIDPPYPIADESLNYLLNFIDENDMLEEDGLITGEIPFELELKKEYKNFYLKKDKKFSKLTRIWQYAKK